MSILEPRTAREGVGTRLGEDRGTLTSARRQNFWVLGRETRPAGMSAMPRKRRSACRFRNVGECQIRDMLRSLAGSSRRVAYVPSVVHVPMKRPVGCLFILPQFRRRRPMLSLAVPSRQRRYFENRNASFAAFRRLGVSGPLRGQEIAPGANSHIGDLLAYRTFLFMMEKQCSEAILTGQHRCQQCVPLF